MVGNLYHIGELIWPLERIKDLEFPGALTCTHTTGLIIKYTGRILLVTNYVPHALYPVPKYDPCLSLKGQAVVNLISRYVIVRGF